MDHGIDRPADVSVSRRSLADVHGIMLIGIYGGLVRNERLIHCRVSIPCYAIHDRWSGVTATLIVDAREVHHVFTQPV